MWFLKKWFKLRQYYITIIWIKVSISKTVIFICCNVVSFDPDKLFVLQQIFTKFWMLMFLINQVIIYCMWREVGLWFHSQLSAAARCENKQGSPDLTMIKSYNRPHDTLSNTSRWPSTIHLEIYIKVFYFFSLSSSVAFLCDSQ